MIVRTRGLTKRYGSHAALDGVDLAVPEGSVYGLVGPNGAGKTTLLGLLARLRHPTEGSFEIGTETARTAYLPENPQFEPWLTGRELVELARTLAPGDVPPERTNDVLREVGLTEAASRRIGGYSRGMKQRLGLAAALVGSPALLLLDEPSSALDPIGRRDVLELVRTLRGRTTTIFSSHILADVQEVCDTVGVLRLGQLVFQGTVTELLEHAAARVYVVVVSTGLRNAQAALEARPWVVECAHPAPRTLHVTVSSLGEAERGMSAALAESGAAVVSVNRRIPSLEDVVLDLVR